MRVAIYYSSRVLEWLECMCACVIYVSFWSFLWVQKFLDWCWKVNTMEKIKFLAILKIPKLEFEEPSTSLLADFNKSSCLSHIFWPGPLPFKNGESILAPFLASLKDSLSNISQIRFLLHFISFYFYFLYFM